MNATCHAVVAAAAAAFNVVDFLKDSNIFVCMLSLHAVQCIHVLENLYRTCVCVCLWSACRTCVRTRALCRREMPVVVQ